MGVCIKRIKEILDNRHISIFDKLESTDKDLELVDFYSLVDTYFNNLGFVYGIKEDDFYNLKDDICLFFSYIDSLNLSSIYVNAFINNFLYRLYSFGVIEESRGIYDLLTSDEIRNSKSMKNFFSNGSYFKPDDLNPFPEFIKELYSCMDLLDDECLNKLKYIFHSSRELITYCFDHSVMMKTYFSKNLLSSFDKETLSLLFRTSLSSNYKYFYQADEKSLAIISAMNDFVVKNTGRNAEFLKQILNFFCYGNQIENKIFVNLLNEYYDKYYFKTLEVGFENDKVFLELLNFVLSTSQELDFNSKEKIDNLDSFVRLKKKNLDKLYISCFGNKGFNKILNNTFNENIDFPVIRTNEELDNLKILFFKVVYGIDRLEAYDIVVKYGTYLKECEVEFLDSDKNTFEVLSAICNVFNMELKDEKKIKKLQESLYGYIKANGIYGVSKDSSYIMLSLLIDKMYMNVYEKNLFDISKAKVLYYQDDVSVIDAGLDFNMIVSSVNGVNVFFKDSDNMKNKYNTSSCSNNQGMCLSFINNENLGVISLTTALIGYNKFNDNSLNLMGIGDLYSETEVISLRLENKDFITGSYYLTPKAFINNTRFGYNELIFDRFLSHDENNEFKVQPSYFVCYKIDDKYMDTLMYQRSLKMASQFGVPLVLIDVKKVKKHEKRIILEKERELFSSKQVNKELLIDIITRYMNNYSGSLTIYRSQKENGNKWQYKADFSISGLSNFLKKVEKRFEDLNKDEVKEWFEALKEAYNIEKKRNQVASEVEEYAYSLCGGEFLLDDKIKFIDKVYSITDDRLNLLRYESGLLDEEKAIYSDDDKAMKVIINIANYLFEDAFVLVNHKNKKLIFQSKKIDDLSEEDLFNYGVVISYLIGNYNNNYFKNLISNPIVDLTNSLDSSLNDYLCCEDSIYKDKKKHFSNVKLLRIIDKIKEMGDVDFINMFQPMLNLGENEIKNIRYGNYFGINPSVNQLLLRKKDISMRFLFPKTSEKIKGKRKV